MQIYLPLVDTFARYHESADTGYDELMDAGSAALSDAIQRYVPRRGDQFIGFAVPIIVDAVRARLRDRVPAAATASRAPGEHPGNGVRAFDLCDERLRLASGFRALRPVEREIFHMRFVDELSSEETESRLGMSREDLARQTFTALAKLRRELEQLGSGRPLAVSNGEALETSAEQAPVAKERHSGRLMLRMPPSLHTELADAARRDRVSLNHFITHTLADAVVQQGSEHGGDRDSGRRAPAPSWLAAAIVANIVVLAVAGILGAILLLVAWQGV